MEMKGMLPIGSDEQRKVALLKCATKFARHLSEGIVRQCMATEPYYMHGDNRTATGAIQPRLTSSQIMEVREKVVEGTKPIMDCIARLQGTSLCGISVIVSENLTRPVPILPRSKKKRIRKKWAKRFGSRDIPSDDIYLVDSGRTAIMSPKMAAKVRRAVGNES
jgi:hypothetical protein